MNRRYLRHIAKLLAVAAAIALFVYWLRQSPLGRRLSSIENARDLVASFAPYDKLTFILTYAVGALFLPGTALSFVGAILYGLWWGTLLVWIAAVLGSLAPYFIAKTAGRTAVQSADPNDSSLQRFDSWVAERGFGGLLLVRFLPIFPYWLVNYGCGLIGVRFRDYVLATAIGIIPGTFVYQYLFSSVGEAVLRDGLHWRQLGDRNVLIPVGVFVLFLVLGRQFALKLGSRTPRKNDSKDIKPMDHSVD